MVDDKLHTLELVFRKPDDLNRITTTPFIVIELLCIKSILEYCFWGQYLLTE